MPHRSKKPFPDFSAVNLGFTEEPETPSSRVAKPSQAADLGCAALPWKWLLQLPNPELQRLPGSVKSGQVQNPGQAQIL